jgi:prophage regulatory protein
MDAALTVTTVVIDWALYTGLPQLAGEDSTWARSGLARRNFYVTPEMQCNTTQRFGRQHVKLLSYENLRADKGVLYSKAHLWRLERAGKFPKRVPLGQSRHGWLDSEIDAWIEQRAAERGRAVV